MSYEDAYVLHMTHWCSLLVKMSEAKIRYLYARLRDLKLDALTVDHMIIDEFKFPVFFALDDLPPIEDPLQRNFHCMLVTTMFPICPACEQLKTYPFSKVEEPVSLPWLQVPLTEGRRSLSVEMIMNSEYKFLASRPKIDGVLFSGISLLETHYILGSFWMQTRMKYDQLEYESGTATFFCVKPQIPCILQEQEFEVRPHPILPYSKKTNAEGIMIFVANNQAVQELRVKKENTVELSVKKGFVEVAGEQKNSTKVEDGIYECAYRNEKWVPVRRREGKIETTRPLEKVLAIPVVSALPDRPFYPLVKKWSNIGQEGFFLTPSNQWEYRHKWTLNVGREFGKDFFISESDPYKPMMYRWFRTQSYVALSDTHAVCTGFVETDPPWKVSPIRGVALVSYFGDRIGVVIERGKLYTLPGGKFEGNELPQQALQRELQEELPFSWSSIAAYGPYENGPCTYYIAERVVTGLIYVPLSHPYVASWVRRVVADSLKQKPGKKQMSDLVNMKPVTEKPPLDSRLAQGIELRELERLYTKHWRKHTKLSVLQIGSLVVARSTVALPDVRMKMSNVLTRQQIEDVVRIVPLLPCPVSAVNRVVPQKGPYVDGLLKLIGCQVEQDQIVFSSVDRRPSLVPYSVQDYG